MCASVAQRDIVQSEGQRRVGVSGNPQRQVGDSGLELPHPRQQLRVRPDMTAPDMRCKQGYENLAKLHVGGWTL